MPDEYHECLSHQFSIEHKKSDQSALKLPHYHEQYEVFLTLTHKMLVQVNGKNYFPPYGTLILLNNADIHIMCPQEKNYERYVMYFSPEFVSEMSSEQTNLLDCFLFRPFKDPFFLPLNETQFSLIYNQMDNIDNLNQNEKHLVYGSDLQLKYHVGSLLITINNFYRSYHEIGISLSNPNYSVIYQILNYIHSHLQEDLSLELLGKKFYLNKSNLCTYFKKVTNMSPSQYVIFCRINKAKDLLANDHSVEEVSDAVGYNNLSHFSKSFKKLVGISPKKYQLSCRKNIDERIPSEGITQIISTKVNSPLSKQDKCLDCICRHQCPYKLPLGT